MPAGEIAEPVRSLTPLISKAADDVARVATSYAAQRIDGTAAILNRIAALQDTCSTLAFQRLAWLTPLYESLAADLDAKPLAVEVTDATTGELAVLLPLVETREGGLEVVSWASLGVSDYGAPLLGPKTPANARDAEAMWAAVKRCLKGCDLVQLANMPDDIDGRPNPFALLKSRRPSRHARHALTLPGTVEQFLASRGKKYRKEAERCGRLLAEKGTPEFRRAETEPEISQAYAALQTQQHERHAARGSDYRLDQAAYARFFATALRHGTPLATAHIFTLKAGGETGAVLYGISHGSTFTLLRISTGGESWKRVSPGRLIVLDAMRYFLERGISTFDMGIGDYDFKQGFGIASEPLVDVVAALSLRGAPTVALARTKARARQYPGLVEAAKRVLGRT